MKWIIALLFLAACSQSAFDDIRPESSFQAVLSDVEPPQEYAVHTISSWSSSGGNRHTDIAYTIRNGEIVDCSGNYTFSRENQSVTPCTAENAKELGAQTMQELAATLWQAEFAQNGSCYMRSDGSATVCFEDNGIVNYTVSSRAYYVWKVEK